MQNQARQQGALEEWIAFGGLYKMEVTRLEAPEDFGRAVADEVDKVGWVEDGGRDSMGGVRSGKIK